MWCGFILERALLIVLGLHLQEAKRLKLEATLVPVAGVFRVVHLPDADSEAEVHDYATLHADGATMREIAAVRGFVHYKGYYELVETERIPTNTELLIFSNYPFKYESGNDTTAGEALGRVDAEFDLSPTDCPADHKIFVHSTVEGRTFSAEEPVLFRMHRLCTVEYLVRQDQASATTYTHYFSRSDLSYLVPQMGIAYRDDHGYYKVKQKERIWAGQKLVLFENGEFLTDDCKVVRQLLKVNRTGNFVVGPTSIGARELFVQCVWSSVVDSLRRPVLYKVRLIHMCTPDTN